MYHLERGKKKLIPQHHHCTMCKEIYASLNAGYYGAKQPGERVCARVPAPLCVFPLPQREPLRRDAARCRSCARVMQQGVDRARVSSDCARVISGICSHVPYLEGHAARVPIEGMRASENPWPFPLYFSVTRPLVYST